MSIIFRPNAADDQDCTSGPLRTSTRVSSVRPAQHSSPAFGSRRVRFGSTSPARRCETAGGAPRRTERPRDPHFGDGSGWVADVAADPVRSLRLRSARRLEAGGSDGPPGPTRDFARAHWGQPPPPPAPPRRRDGRGGVGRSGARAVEGGPPPSGGLPLPPPPAPPPAARAGARGGRGRARRRVLAPSAPGFGDRCCRGGAVTPGDRVPPAPPAETDGDRAGTPGPPSPPGPSQPSRSRSRRTAAVEVRPRRPVAGRGRPPPTPPPAPPARRHTPLGRTPTPTPRKGDGAAEGTGEERAARTGEGRRKRGAGKIRREPPARPDARRRVESSGRTARTPPVYLLTQPDSGKTRARRAGGRYRPPHRPRAGPRSEGLGPPRAAPGVVFRRGAGGAEAGAGKGRGTGAVWGRGEAPSEVGGGGGGGRRRRRRRGEREGRGGRRRGAEARRGRRNRPRDPTHPHASAAGPAPGTTPRPPPRTTTPPPPPPHPRPRTNRAPPPGRSFPFPPPPRTSHARPRGSRRWKAGPVGRGDAHATRESRGESRGSAGADPAAGGRVTRAHAPRLPRRRRPPGARRGRPRLSLFCPPPPPSPALFLGPAGSARPALPPRRGRRRRAGRPGRDGRGGRAGAMGGTAPGRDGTDGRRVNTGRRRRWARATRRDAAAPREGSARGTDTAASRGPPRGVRPRGRGPRKRDPRGLGASQTDPGAARDAVPGRERRGDAGIRRLGVSASPRATGRGGGRPRPSLSRSSRRRDAHAIGRRLLLGDGGPADESRAGPRATPSRATTPPSPAGELGSRPPRGRRLIVRRRSDRRSPGGTRAAKSYEVFTRGWTAGGARAGVGEGRSRPPPPARARAPTPSRPADAAHSPLSRPRGRSEEGDRLGPASTGDDETRTPFGVGKRTRRGGPASVRRHPRGRARGRHRTPTGARGFPPPPPRRPRAERRGRTARKRRAHARHHGDGPRGSPKPRRGRRGRARGRHGPPRRPTWPVVGFGWRSPEETGKSVCVCVGRERTGTGPRTARRPITRPHDPRGARRPDPAGGRATPEGSLNLRAGSARYLGQERRTGEAGRDGGSGSEPAPPPLELPPPPPARRGTRGTGRGAAGPRDAERTHAPPTAAPTRSALAPSLHAPHLLAPPPARETRGDPGTRLSFHDARRASGAGGGRGVPLAEAVELAGRRVTRGEETRRRGGRAGGRARTAGEGSETPATPPHHTAWWGGRRRGRRRGRTGDPERTTRVRAGGPPQKRPHPPGARRRGRPAARETARGRGDSEGGAGKRNARGPPPDAPDTPRDAARERKAGPAVIVKFTVFSSAPPGPWADPGGGRSEGLTKPSNR
uniref:Collagen alpha-1(I) chain-like n=1 Tax=Castor canadensis TaxID=51338 RepID=A0A8B7TJK5_CASCN|nr:collagen alpha-1(I) chain-like [Castor canadensis]